MFECLTRHPGVGKFRTTQLDSLGKQNPWSRWRGGGSDRDLRSQPALHLAGVSPGHVLASLCLGPQALEQRRASPQLPGLLTARTLHLPPDFTP